MLHGGTSVDAIGVNADGSIAIVDPNPAARPDIALPTTHGVVVERVCRSGQYSYWQAYWVRFFESAPTQNAAAYALFTRSFR